MGPFIPIYTGLGAATFVVAFIQMFALTVSAKRQGRRIRMLLFEVRFVFYFFLSPASLFKKSV